MFTNFCDFVSEWYYIRILLHIYIYNMYTNKYRIAERILSKRIGVVATGPGSDDTIT